MKRRDFLRTLLALAATPTVVFTAAAGLKDEECDLHTRFAAEMFGEDPNTLKAYSEADARVTFKMIRNFRRYGWHYAGRVHDSVCFDQIGDA